MESVLQRTRQMLRVALIVIVPALVLAARSTFLVVVPTCDASLERAEFARAAPVAIPPSVEGHLALGAPIPQLTTTTWIDQELELDLQGRASGATLVLHENDALAILRCGEVRLNAGGVGEKGGELERRASGDYEYLDHSYGDSSRDAVRVVPGVRRHVQFARIFTRRNLPAALVLLATFALALGAMFMRRGSVYVMRVRHWRAAELLPEGRIDDHGTTLGVLENAPRDIVPGPILVAPEALHGQSSYRDVPIIARRHGATGTHEEWTAATARRFANARVMAALAAAAAICSVAATAFAAP